MRRLSVLLCLLLALPFLCTAQTTRRPQRKQTPPSNESKVLEDQLREATADYKKSLYELLKLREQSLNQRQADLSKTKALAAQGALTQDDVKRAEADVSAAQQKVDEVRSRIKNADRMLIEAGVSPLKESAIQVAPLVPKCELTIEDAPEIRGLKLRMLKKDVQMLLPSLVPWGESRVDTVPIRQGDYGESSALFLSIPYGPEAEKLKGMGRLELRFLDGRLSVISIEYDESTKWASLDEFVQKISEALKLPSAWRTHENRFEGKRMECQGFNIEAKEGLSGPSITFSDIAAPIIVKQRMKEEERKAKETFKP